MEQKALFLYNFSEKIWLKSPVLMVEHEFLAVIYRTEFCCRVSSFLKRQRNHRHAIIIF